MRSGDIIRWTYNSNMSPVATNEKIWSNTMNTYVPIGGFNLLVSLQGDRLVWFNPEGLFHTSLADSLNRCVVTSFDKVVLRVCE